MFDEPTAGSLTEAIERACRHFRKPIAWRAMQVRAMKQDFRWARSAQRYLDLYRELVPTESTQAIMAAELAQESERFLATAS
jgi:glycogen synthase